MNNLQSPEYVTRPLLPDLQAISPLLEEIWNSGFLTNNALIHQRFEKALSDFLGVEYISLFTNGTLPLITALQALEIKGEVITTPYSFIATSHSLHWNGLTPVFADVDPIYGNLDPQRIEDAITSATTAIMPVHVYGNPCDTDAIDDIASRHNLKVIYDAAHAFGVKRDGVSILLRGDLSTLSFHATKTFTTAEGGAMVMNSPQMKRKVDYLKNFGFKDETHVMLPGINSKMDEIRAAIGLKGLEIVEQATCKRKIVAETYREHLRDIKGVRILEDIPGVIHNYGYFPIFIDERHYPLGRDNLYDLLKSKNIFGRRYFYPLISEFSPYSGLPSSSEANLPNAVNLSRSVICLPIHHLLSPQRQMEIISTIINHK